MFVHNENRCLNGRISVFFFITFNKRVRPPQSSDRGMKPVLIHKVQLKCVLSRWEKLCVLRSIHTVELKYLWCAAAGFISIYKSRSCFIPASWKSLLSLTSSWTPSNYRLFLRFTAAFEHVHNFHLRPALLVIYPLWRHDVLTLLHSQYQDILMWNFKIKAL